MFPSCSLPPHASLNSSSLLLVFVLVLSPGVRRVLWAEPAGPPHCWLIHGIRFPQWLCLSSESGPSGCRFQWMSAVLRSVNTCGRSQPVLCHISSCVQNYIDLGKWAFALQRTLGSRAAEMWLWLCGCEGWCCLNNSWATQHFKCSLLNCTGPRFTNITGWENCMLYV